MRISDWSSDVCSSDLRALRDRRPDLSLTVQATLPRPFLEGVLGGPFDLVCEAADVGLVNRSAFEVALDASAAAYRVFHDEWDGRVSAAADRRRAAAPRQIGKASCRASVGEY